MQCDGNTLETCQNGTFQDSMPCPMVCNATLGCVLCEPGTGTCNNGTSHACNADGNGYDDILCDAAEGQSCDTNSGVCVGNCSANMLGESYIGCEYYPTVTGNLVGDNFDFAVAISNTANQPSP